MTTGRMDAGAAQGAAARSFLGWRMVGVAFVAQAVSSTITVSVAGNFVGPIGAAFDVPPTTIGIGPGLAILAMGILGPFVGRALDARQTRPLMTAGAVLAGIGLLAMSRAETLSQLVIAYLALVAPGAALCGALPSMALMASWFERRRGFAIGLAVSGATIVSWVGPASVQWIIDHQGWREATVALGLVTLLLSAPIFALFTIASPEMVGQRPDGDEPPREAEALAGASTAADSGADAAPTEVVLETGELVRDVRLWLAAVGFGLVFTSPIVLVVLLIEFGKSLGFSGQDATVFFAAMVPFSIAGKIFLGRLADVAPLRPTLLMIIVVNLLVWGILCLEPGYALFVATGALYGVGIGGAAPVQGVLMGRLFGRVNFGRASGLGGLAAIPLLSLANIGSQTLLGATGSYRLTFVVQMVLLSIGGLMLGAIKIPDSPKPAS
jgi:MFS family permease